jgi:hypothetical protein
VRTWNLTSWFRLNSVAMHFYISQSPKFSCDFISSNYKVEQPKHHTRVSVCLISASHVMQPFSIFSSFPGNLWVLQTKWIYRQQLYSNCKISSYTRLASTKEEISTKVTYVRWRWKA